MTHQQSKYIIYARRTLMACSFIWDKFGMTRKF